MSDRSNERTMGTPPEITPAEHVANCHALQAELGHDEANNFHLAAHQMGALGWGQTHSFDHHIRYCEKVGRFEHERGANLSYAWVVKAMLDHVRHIKTTPAATRKDKVAS